MECVDNVSEFPGISPDLLANLHEGPSPKIWVYYNNYNTTKHYNYSSSSSSSSSSNRNRNKNSNITNTTTATKATTETTTTTTTTQTWLTTTGNATGYPSNDSAIQWTTYKSTPPVYKLFHIFSPQRYAKMGLYHRETFQMHQNKSLPNTESHDIVSRCCVMIMPQSEVSQNVWMTVCFVTCRGQPKCLNDGMLCYL